MGIGGLGMTELVIILVIILIIFGAGKLPEIGSGLGRAIKNFKKGVTDTSKVASSDDSEKVTDSRDSNETNEELKSKDDSESKD